MVILCMTLCVNRKSIETSHMDRSEELINTIFIVKYFLIELPFHTQNVHTTFNVEQKQYTNEKKEEKISYTQKKVSFQFNNYYNDIS